MPELTRQAKKENIRIQIVGDRSLLTEVCRKSIERAERMTAELTSMTAILAIGYGGQEEIARAVQELAITKEDLTEVSASDILSVLET